MAELEILEMDTYRDPENPQAETAIRVVRTGEETSVIVFRGNLQSVIDENGRNVIKSGDYILALETEDQILHLAIALGDWNKRFKIARVSEEIHAKHPHLPLGALTATTFTERDNTPPYFSLEIEDGVIVNGIPHYSDQHPPAANDLQAINDALEEFREDEKAVCVLARAMGEMAEHTDMEFEDLTMSPVVQLSLGVESGEEVLESFSHCFQLGSLPMHAPPTSVRSLA